MGRVVAIGEAIVEIMRKTVDSPLYAADDFVGPFPSGAPAIFIDQVARLGHDAGFIGAVGDDDFGRCLLDRFADDGVDSTNVARIDDIATGCAFVTYFSDGERQFIFHIGNSAAGCLPEITPEMFQGADWLHICGSTLSAGERMMQACYDACELATDAGARVSFDPNLRPELLGGEEALRRVCGPIVDTASLILPSATEAELLTDTDEPKAACQALLDRGAEIVALKRGQDGCTVFADGQQISVGSYQVDAIDPTGAGDSFDAAFVVGLMEQRPLEQIGRLANACGALGATKKGPMEGCAMREDAFDLAGLNQ